MPGTLAARLEGDHIPAFLNVIWLADDREAALARQSSLLAGESVLTPAGDWFGPNWADLGQGGALGTLALLGERERLHTELAIGEQALVQLDTQLKAADADRAHLHSAFEASQRTLREQELRWQQLREAWSLQQGQRQERRLRLGQLGEELIRLDKEQAEEAERLAAGRALEISASAVGKGVARLEQEVGVRLLQRSTMAPPSRRVTRLGATPTGDRCPCFGHALVIPDG